MKKSWLVVLLAGALAVLWCSSLFAQWLPDKRLTFDGNDSQTSYGNTRCIAVQGNAVHVVWADNRSGNYQVYYKRSTDYGITWGDDTRLNFDLRNTKFPSVAASDSFVHVLFSGNQYPGGISYKRSTDRGATWGPEIPLASGGWGDAPHSIAASDSNVHIVWQGMPPISNIYSKRSTDNGTTWSPDILVSVNTSNSWGPSVAISPQGIVHAAWHYNYPNGGYEIYYARSTNNGASWEERRLSDDDHVHSYSPSVAVSGSSGSNVHVVWWDYRDGNYEIYTKRSTDYGVSWGLDTRLTYDPSRSEYPSIAASGSNVHLVWPDYRDGNWEIYYKFSSDDGVSWDPDTRLTENLAYSDFASVAPSGDGVVNVVWTDGRDGNNEIYYKRGGGVFPGCLTEASQGRHMVRDPATGTIHLVMHTEGASPRVYYTKTTDGGVHWDSISVLGNGQYPTVGLAWSLLGGPYICVAYKRPDPEVGSRLCYRWFDPVMGGWQPSVNISTSSNPGPPSLVVSGSRVYVAFKSGAAVLCSNFEYNTPGSYATQSIVATGSPALPCLAVDGAGDVHAAWRRTTGANADEIYYSKRVSGSWQTPTKVYSSPGYLSTQPFVECYGDSVYVVWTEGDRSLSDVRRAAKPLTYGIWDWIYVSNSSDSSVSPAQAWREFTTWSEATPTPWFDVKYWRPSGMTGFVLPNPTQWSYWTHSQMSYFEPDLFTHLWSAWTESPNAGQPPYRVLFKHTSFPFFGPGLGGELSDYGNYYKVLAGQDTASVYCLKRDGVLRFADKAVDFARDSLVYELPYLDPVYDYYLRVSSYRETGNGWVQALSVNGGASRTVRFSPNQVDTAWIHIPPGAYAQDRKVTFSFKNVQGDYVTNFGMTLFQRDPKPRGKSGPQAGEPTTQPFTQEVFGVYPNPTKGQAQIDYSLKAPERVQLGIYDVTGRLVREVVNGPQLAGVHRASWNGRTASGQQVPSGIYFVKLTSPGVNKTSRFVIVR